MSVRVAIYGRTYLDAELAIDLAVLAAGKGKVDVEVIPVLGGFACNAARALARRLPPHSIQLVTAIPAADRARLRAAVPPRVGIAPLVRPTLAWPPISVIVNPANECKLLRGSGDDDADAWRLTRIGRAVRVAPLHVVGRVPIRFVRELRAHTRSTGALLAWCGGDGLPLALERELDLVCVNTAEARRMVGLPEAEPALLAQVLAARARPGGVRLVTGRASAPAVVAHHQHGGEITSYLRAPAPLAASRIRTKKGVGDVFAATFLIDTCFDRRGGWRKHLDVAGGLAAAQRAATTFLTRSAR
ncbi:hypothetical protein BH11MYX3_BH11MYX3_37120 [soil metagenome]